MMPDVRSTKVKRQLALLGREVFDEYTLLDLAVGEAVEDIEVSCRKGCSACCRQLVQGTTSEVAVIVAAYPSEIWDRRRQIREQEKRLSELICDVFGIEAFEKGVGVYDAESLEDYRKKNKEVADLWWLERRDCVFLLPDQTCAVYRARPIACRTHLAISEPAVCEGGRGKVSILDLIDERNEARFRVDGGVSATFAYLPQLLRMAAEELSKP